MTSRSPGFVSDDEGFSAYLRFYWKMQELTTDEAIIGWNDGTIRRFTLVKPGLLVMNLLELMYRRFIVSSSY